MKKIILLWVIIIIIPLFIVTIFIKEKQIDYGLISKRNVRILLEEEDKIIEMPLENYVLGVVAGEMPMSFTEEALKAQAVAARTYVLKKMEGNSSNDYDVIDTVTNQVYLTDENMKERFGENYTTYINKLNKVIKETEGKYITFDNKAIDALFFSTSVGKTENSEEVFSSYEPYLRSVESTYDEISPSYTITKEFSLNDFYSLLGLEYSDTLNVENIETTSTGRTKLVKINGVEFTGSDVFSKLTLKSTFFTIQLLDNKIITTTKGYGHGVGMSQYGAEGMARKGFSYDEILLYYYTGVKLKKL